MPGRKCPVKYRGREGLGYIINNCYRVIIRSSHWRCFIKKILFKISQENTCAGVSFLIKLRASACRCLLVLASKLKYERKNKFYILHVSFLVFSSAFLYQNHSTFNNLLTISKILTRKYA